MLMLGSDESAPAPVKHKPLTSAFKSHGTAPPPAKVARPLHSPTAPDAVVLYHPVKAADDTSDQ